MKTISIICITVAFLLCGCSSNKLILKNNKFYTIRENVSGDKPPHEILVLKPNKAFRGEVSEKLDHVIITAKNKVNFDTSIVEIDEEQISPKYDDLISRNYYPEFLNDSLNFSRFNYCDIKFGLQTMTIPLKFRKGIGDNILNPPQVETGFNVGFAPGAKFTLNTYRQTKNYLGKNTSQFAIALGPHFGLGATDLKKASNAPGLISDRKRPLFTWGGYFILGFNNVNVGVALGADYVLGTGNKNWVYQGKPWTGVILSLDILKF